MKYEQKEVIIQNDQNKNNYNKKIISPNVIDFLSLKEPEQKKVIEKKTTLLILNLLLII